MRRSWPGRGRGPIINLPSVDGNAGSAGTPPTVAVRVLYAPSDMPAGVCARILATRGYTRMHMAEYGARAYGETFEALGRLPARPLR
jgi:hypothetical protein